jgi:hypothetical protein
VPSSFTGNRILLNFGAVDYEATVFINGLHAGFNGGGYSRFTVDVTNYTIADGPNELDINPDSLTKSCGANISEQFTGLPLSMTPQIAATMSSRSAIRHCAHRISSTGPAMASGKVPGSS